VTGAVVLAAGRGSRLGAPKAAAWADGRTFVEAVLRTLHEAGIGDVRVVLSAGLAESLVPDPVLPALAVVNPDPARGMLSSVRCGLDALPAGLDAVLLWPVDHPRVSSATIRALVSAHAASAAPVVVPIHAGVRGHPVVFDARVLPELLAAPPDVGARAVVHAHADRLELAVDDGAVTEDIDSAADYERVFGPRPAMPRDRR
jgi:CTP:molybdopterin cytidylyltransferase MocA